MKRPNKPFLINDLENIVLTPIIDGVELNHYVLKKNSLLFFNTVILGLMDDIPADKIKKSKYYKENVIKYIFSWCIICLSNER